MIDVVALFEKYEDEFLKFDLVTHRPFQQKDLCAFIKLAEIVPGDGWMVSDAGYEIIYLSPSIEDLNEAATEEDILYLIRCGVLYDEETESLFMHV